MVDDDRKVRDKRTNAEKLTWVYTLIFCSVIFSSTFFFVGFFYFPIDTSGLKTSVDRLIYTIQWLMVSALAIHAGIHGVGSVRASTSAIDPLEGNAENLVEVPNKILRNTMEQFILHAVGLITLSTYLTETNMKCIPILVLIFLIGRLCFWYAYGYSMQAMNRAFGFATTYLPTVGVYLYCLYRFMD